MMLSNAAFDDLQRVVALVSPITGELECLTVSEVVVTNTGGEVVARLHRSVDSDGPWNVEFAS